MPKQVSVEVLGHVGKGINQKQAKLDAMGKIEALSDGRWEPEVLQWRGYALLLWRTLEGWQYRFLRHAGGPLLEHSGCSFGDGKYASTMRSAMCHLDQIGWTVDDPLDLHPFMMYEEDRKASVDYREQQMKVHELTAKGYDSFEVFDIMSGRLADTRPDPVTA